MGSKVPKGYHRMPNGKLMKDSDMKKKPITDKSKILKQSYLYNPKSNPFIM